MTEDDGIGIIGLQRAEQGHEGRLLFPGTGVGRDALGRQSTLIAHPDGVLVVVAGMCPRQVVVPRLIQLTIASDVVVVAAEPEAGIVAGNEVLYGESTVSARGAAVNDNQINAAHDVVVNDVAIAVNTVMTI